MYISERILMKTTANNTHTENGLNLGRYMIASFTAAAVVCGAVITQIL